MTYNIPTLSAGPYKDNTTNLIYNWLFCDDIELFKINMGQAPQFPWNVLFNETVNVNALESIIQHEGLETRAKMLACNLLQASGHKPEKKELLAVIVEVALEDGLDTLAAFKDGTARYINQSGKMIVWDAVSDASDTLIKELFAVSIPVIKQIGPWENGRRPHPATGMARISFIVSDGLYFGEAPVNALFNEPLARPALLSATALMEFLTTRVLDSAVN